MSDQRHPTRLAQMMCIAGVVLFGTLVFPARATTTDPPPNFVLIFTDDQGYADLSCFGGDHIHTPRIDRMAAEGMKLTSFYVAAPVCTPSRAALMTGCYPKRIDMATGSNFVVLLAGDTKGLHPEEVTIAEVLKPSGYKTGIFGKWHLGDQPLLDTLKRNGLDENTLVIFTSDNGPAIGSAAPLRGRKGSTFEGGMREPTVIRWPGKIPAGVTNSELVTAMDLLPTFAKLAGAKFPRNRVIDGKDIWPVLSGDGKSPHEFFFYHKQNELQAVRSGQWKLHVKNGVPVALYNLENDISERQNVLERNGPISERLLAQIETFQKDLSENSRPASFVDNPRPLSK